MDFRSTPIWEEAQAIIEDGPKPVHFKYTAVVDNGEEEVASEQVTMLDIDRDYNANYADKGSITLRLNIKDYVEQIYPLKDNLLISITKEPIGEVGSESASEDEVVTTTYRGILVDPKSPHIEAQDPNETDTSAYEKLPPKEYTFQLVDPGVEQLRMKSTGGIYRDMTVQDVLIGTIGLLSNNLELDNDLSVIGVDMADANNDKVYDHVIIPHGKPFTELADYLQKEYGIYTTGIGIYSQNRYWYIFPIYNVKRFEEVSDNLTILNIPPGKFPGIERTYITEDRAVTFLSTGQSEHQDLSEIYQLNYGNGIRFVEGDRYLKDFHTAENNITEIHKDDNVYEYNLRDRASSTNMAMVSPRRITSNREYEISAVSAGLGSIVTVIWENANPDLLYPGMPVRYMYIEDEDVIETYGTLLGASHIVIPEEGKITNTKYKCAVSVVIFIENKE